MSNQLVGNGLVGTVQFDYAASQAAKTGATPECELVMSGILCARDYAGFIASTNGLECLNTAQLSRLIVTGEEDLDGGFFRTGASLISNGWGQTSHVFSLPQCPRRNKIQCGDGETSAVTTTQELGDAWRDLKRSSLIDLACGRLAKKTPEFSAFRRLTRWQACVLGFCVLALLAIFVSATNGAMQFFAFVFTTLFASVILLRFACLAPEKPAPPNNPGRQLPDHKLPVYSILVALFHEANMVEQLTRALCAIDYPASLLDIKLVLEEDDHETIAAVRALDLPGCFEIIIVPPCKPRTKPKALNFALPFARGELLAIYDAEDIPDPDQLRRAAMAFHYAQDDVACMQAALAYYNADRNWLTRQFAIEYAGLFDVILPKLANTRLPVPLGGTSNHFRTEILREVGGRDPYNVTEDADLGIRLGRVGYRIEMLASTTHEEAVWQLGNWTRQRSRWLKGWIQTWFVHNRAPLKLIGELGILRFLVLQILLIGIVLSAVGYPFFLALIAYKAVSGSLVPSGTDVAGQILFAVQMWVLLAGFGVNMVLSWVALKRRKLSRLSLDVLLIPIYWLLISCGAWLAVWQFLTAPFYWEKTQHGNGNSANPSR